MVVFAFIFCYVLSGMLDQFLPYSENFDCGFSVGLSCAVTRHVVSVFFVCLFVLFGNLDAV